MIAGQKVTMKAPHVWCGDAHPEGARLPVFGEVYTIAFIAGHKGDAFLNLCECDPFGMFLAERFRPVKTTDISIFRQMLAPLPSGSGKRARSRSRRPVREAAE